MGAYIAQSGVFTWGYMRRVRHANMTLLGRLCIASWRFSILSVSLGQDSRDDISWQTCVYFFFRFSYTSSHDATNEEIPWTSIWIHLPILPSDFLCADYCTVSPLLPLVAAVNWGSPCIYTDVVVARVHDLIGRAPASTSLAARRSAMNTVYKSRFFIPVEDDA